MCESNKLLILDIDGTLIHADEVANDSSEACDFLIDEGVFHVRMRPHLKEFLTWAFATFAVAVWSLSDKKYVDEILKNILDPGMQPLFVWYGDRCTKVRVREGLYDHSTRYCKELRKVWKYLKTYDKMSTIIVDDTPFTYSRNYGNAVPILSFTGEDDDELLRVQKVLNRLKDAENVRDIISKFHQHR